MHTFMIVVWQSSQIWTIRKTSDRQHSAETILPSSYVAGIHCSDKRRQHFLVLQTSTKADSIVQLYEFSLYVSVFNALLFFNIHLSIHPSIFHVYINSHIHSFVYSFILSEKARKPATLLRCGDCQVACCETQIASDVTQALQPWPNNQ